MFYAKICQRPDSNCGLLVSEATTLPTELQPPLPLLLSLSLSLSLSSFPSPSTSLSHFKSFSQFVWHLFSYHSLFHFELDLVFATYLRPTIFLLSNFKSLSPLDPFVCLSYVLACPLEDWIIFLSFLSRYLPIYHLTLSLNSLCS